MKQNQNQNTINLDQPAELTLNLGSGMEHFVVTGDAEAVMPYVEAAQAYDKRHIVKDTAIGRKAVTGALETLTAPIQTGLGRVAVDIKAIAYDKVHGTAMYDLLKQKRDDERNLAFATKLGLVSTTHCAKHSKALAQLKRIV